MEVAAETSMETITTSSGENSPRTPLGLAGMPPEILYGIFSRCPTLDVATRLRKVSRLFYSLVTNDAWWMTRIMKSPYEIRLTGSQLAADDFSAWRTVHALEVEAGRWTRWGAPLQEITGPTTSVFQGSSTEVQKPPPATPALWKREDVVTKDSLRMATDAHASTMDAVRLFRDSQGRRLCLSGGRDRAIKLWDVNKIQTVDSKAAWKLVDKQNAHCGWIWSIDRPSADGQFYSCGWDCQVKLWQIGEAAITELRSSRVPSAATCVVSGLEVAGSPHSVVVVGTFCKKLFFFDFREGGLVQTDSRPLHKKAVFGLAHDGHNVYSCGEDRRIVKIDCRVPGKAITEITLEDYAQGISLAHGQLVVGTQKGHVIAFNAKDLSEEYRFVAATSSLRHVVHTRAAILALSKNRRLSVFTVGSSPRLLAVSKEFDSEPSRFDYFRGDVVVGGGDGSLLFWPKLTSQDQGYSPLS